MVTKRQYRVAEIDGRFYVQKRTKGWLFWTDWYDYPCLRKSTRPIFETEVEAKTWLDKRIAWRYKELEPCVVRECFSVEFRT